MEVYDALNLDDRSDWRAWNTNVEVIIFKWSHKHH